MSGMDREAAWGLLVENVGAQGLRRHMLAVEAAMRGYAGRLGEDLDLWGLAGLLHDFDWEIHPTLESHPAEGAPTLRQRRCPGEGVRALLAGDEGTGLISAAALVRPSKDVREVEVKSIKKRWKERSFAAGVHREE